MSSIFRTGFLFIILCFGMVARVQAQAVTIDTLVIGIWPDYDRTAVLVLITGTLPEDATLPATIALPLPADAELNAVARITDDLVMTDDVEYTLEDDVLVFDLSDRRFRVEYYFPYVEDGNGRQFDFSWLAEMPVNQLEVAVQQPASATALQTEPATANVTQDNDDGLTYHVLPAQSVAGGVPYEVSVSYEMSSPTLTVNRTASSVEPATEAPAAPTAAVDSDGFDWPLLLAGLGLGLILAAVVWQVASNRNKRKRPSNRPTKPRPAKSAKSTGKVNFCHECGAKLTPHDKFCRECGMAVKQK